MKTILWILLLSATLCNASDKYYPYLDTTARWYFKKTVRVDDGIFNQKTIDTYENYSFKKDTVINNRQCYRAYCSYKGYSYEMPLGLFNEKDSIVYMLYYSHGDTLTSTADYSFNFTSNDILDYKGYLLSRNNDIIEAIGSSQYFSIGIPWGVYYNGEKVVVSANLYHEVAVELLCYERDGKIIYQNPAYTSCWPETVSTAQVGNEETALVASPLRGTSLVRTAGFDLLRLVSASGSELLRIPLQGADMYSLDASSFPAGNYILVLSRADGSSVRQTVQVVR